MNRKERRAALQLNRKNPISATQIPEPGAPFPPLPEISPARRAANRANAQLSTGPLSSATRAISAQNHASHGLARHDRGFRLAADESSVDFDSFLRALLEEHQPSTESETLLVHYMAESHWLAARAQRLQDSCMDPKTGAITDEKKFSLYLRYQTTHRRAFHKALNDLLKVRAEKRKAELGFEAQRIASEKHEMKKQAHYWEVLKKDAEACRQISLNTLANLQSQTENPDFEAEYTAALAKFGLKKEVFNAASAA